MVTWLDVFQTIRWWETDRYCLFDTSMSQKPPFFPLRQADGFSQVQPRWHRFEEHWKELSSFVADLFQGSGWNPNWIHGQFFINLNDLIWPSKSLWDCLIGYRKGSSQRFTFYTILLMRSQWSTGECGDILGYLGQPLTIIHAARGLWRCWSLSCWPQHSVARRVSKNPCWSLRVLFCCAWIFNNEIQQVTSVKYHAFDRLHDCACMPSDPHQKENHEFPRLKLPRLVWCWVWVCQRSLCQESSTEIMSLHGETSSRLPYQLRTLNQSHGAIIYADGCTRLRSVDRRLMLW